MKTVCFCRKNTHVWGWNASSWLPKQRLFRLKKVCFRKGIFTCLQDRLRNNREEWWVQPHDISLVEKTWVFAGKKTMHWNHGFGGNNHFAARFLLVKKKQGTFVAARFVFQCKTKVCSSRLFLFKNKLWNTHVHTIVSKKTNNQTTKNERRFGTSEFEVCFEIWFVI